MIKMIVTDLDNTLLRSDGTISDFTVSVLTKCRDKGFKIVYATARSTWAAARYMRRFNPDLFIGYGGARITNGADFIQETAIPADISAQLIQECLNTAEITVVHAINESVALTNRFMADAPHYRCTDFSDTQALSFLKISVRATDPEAVARIAAHYPLCDLLRYTGEDLYRFAHRDAVKWNAVNAAAKHYGLNAEELAAFGDDINDLDMIRHCGTGVAVENAIPEVREAASFICDANDRDGVAKWLEEQVL